jgi:transposase-like protein
MNAWRIPERIIAAVHPDQIADIGRYRRRHGDGTSSATPATRWHLDEVFVSIAGRQMYLWCVIDDEGEVLDILVQAWRDRSAALRLGGSC